VLTENLSGNDNNVELKALKRYLETYTKKSNFLINNDKTILISNDPIISLRPYETLQTQSH